MRLLLKGLLLSALCLVSCWACSEVPSAPEESNENVEAVSLLGDPLLRPRIVAATRSKTEADLQQARTAYEAAPESLEAALRYGCQKAFLHRYREAIQIFSEALEKHPDNPRLLRHRGHRFVTLREFPSAIRDLSRAAELMDGKEDEIELDGAPDSRSELRSTLKFNIWYHLALAYFFNGEFTQAYSAFGECQIIARANADMLVAATHWLYVATRRVGLDSDAELLLDPIHLDLDVIENQDYLDLLMLYKGHYEAEDVLAVKDSLQRPTRAFGVAHFFKMNGREDEANELFLESLANEQWPSFGYIACEAELSRL